MKSMKRRYRSLALILAIVSVISIFPARLPAYAGTAALDLEITDPSRLTIIGNTSNQGFFPAEGGQEGKLEIVTQSAQIRDSHLHEPDFMIDGGDFTLSFSASFQSLVENTHASYWLYNGFGVGVSYRDGEGKLRTLRVNFCKLNANDQTVHVTVGKGGGSFNFAGAATNFNHMTVDLSNPTEFHRWSLMYSSEDNALTLLLDGQPIRQNGVTLAPTGNPWFINTNSTFGKEGLVLTNVLFSTAASYVAPGTNNHVLLDSMSLETEGGTGEEGFTLTLAENDGSDDGRLLTAGMAAANSHRAGAEIRATDGAILAKLDTALNTAAQLYRYDPAFLAGQGSFELSFTASLNSMVTLKTQTAVGLNGVGIQLNVPDGEGNMILYRINMSSLNPDTGELSLYLGKRAAAPVTALTGNNLFSAHSARIDNPGEPHAFKLAYDSASDRMTLFIDGVSVASQQSPGIVSHMTLPVNGNLPGLYITNAISAVGAVDMSLPGNDVLLDDFRLVKHFDGDEAAVDYALDVLRLSSIKGINPGSLQSNLVRNDLILPEGSAAAGVSFNWDSSNEQAVSPSGQVSPGQTEQTAALTVLASRGDAEKSKSFDLIVLAEEPELSPPRSSPALYFTELCDSVDEPARWARGHTRDSFSFIDSHGKSADYETDIPEGRFMVYQRGGSLGQSRIHKINVIPDGGAFSIEMDARLIELARPAPSQTRESYRAVTGFGIGATAAGRSFFATLNNMEDGTLDVYIATENGTAGAPVDMNAMTYQKTTVPFEADRLYHKLALAFDGKNTVSVLIDGETVASAQSRLYPSALLKAEAVYIYGHSLYADPAPDSPTNLVYLDNIAVRKPFAIQGVETDPASNTGLFRAVASVAQDVDGTLPGAGLCLETTLRMEGETVGSVVTPVSSGSVEVLIPNIERAGTVTAVYRLTDSGGALLSEHSEDLRLLSTPIPVLPGDIVTAESGEIYLFQGLDALPDADSWDKMSYTYASGGEGVLLVSGQEAAPLQVPVTLNGWLGVYVGTTADCGEIRISAGGETHLRQLNLSPGEISAGTKQLGDTFVFAANFSGDRLTIELPEELSSVVGYIKLVGLTEEEIAVAQLPPSTQGNANKMMVDDDGMGAFQGGRFTQVSDLYRYVEQIGANLNFGNLSFCMGTSTGLNYDSAYAGRSFEGILDRFRDKMREIDVRQVQSMRAILDESGGQAPAELMAVHGDSRQVNVFANLRMNFCYGVNADFPHLNGPVYFDFYDKGYLTSNGINLSYKNQEVRDYFIGVLTEMAGFASIDGILLDFTRYPILVLDEYENGDYDQKKAFITDFMREVRQTISDQYGEDFKIGVKIIRDTYEADAMDLQRWIDEGLIDLLIASEKSRETFFDPAPFVEMVEGTDTELYVAIISSDVNTIPLTKEQYLLRALSLYREGVDGVMTGTLLPISGEVPVEYRILGDPNELEKWYGLQYPYSLGKATILADALIPAVAPGE